MDLQEIVLDDSSSLVYKLDSFQSKGRNDKNTIVNGWVSTFSYHLHLIYDFYLKEGDLSHGSGFYTDWWDSNLGSGAKECFNFDSSVMLRSGLRYPNNIVTFPWVYPSSLPGHHWLGIIIKYRFKSNTIIYRRELVLKVVLSSLALRNPIKLVTIQLAER